MGTLGAGFSMSLDGFIAGPGDDTRHVFAWMFQGNRDVQVSIGDEDLNLKLTSEGEGQREDMAQALGVILSGRRMFDVAQAWGGKHPLDVPIVVLTHQPPQEWVDKPDSPFVFVTDGLESAVAKAKEIAGEKTVGVGGANVARQCLKAGLLDEIGIDLVPVLLGSGVRLFEELGIEPIALEIADVAPDVGVTHLRYRVVKA
ncbi:dihydrofolate reductase family protein [Aggregatilinea lenta]|uniref:dihydrofolate reductase family protein n=1 Tax=Aggregatilinea lenta TaxID=913108 RepID=UPI000E5B6868|nr:dihydrofolate reductase family protein [Aggregatilinea lenta]